MHCRNGAPLPPAPGPHLAPVGLAAAPGFEQALRRHPPGPCPCTADDAGRKRCSLWWWGRRRRGHGGTHGADPGAGPHRCHHLGHWDRAPRAGLGRYRQCRSRSPFPSFCRRPYRILVLIALGLLCWSANLRGIRRLGLDAEGLVSGQSKLRVLPSHHRRDDDDNSNGQTRSSLNGSALSSTATLVGGSESVDGGSDGATANFGVFLKDPGPQEAAASAGPYMHDLGPRLLGGLPPLCVPHHLFRRRCHRRLRHARGRHAQAMQAIAIFGVVVVTVWPGDVMYRSLRRAFARKLIRICVPSLRQKIHFADVLLADILTSFARVFGDLWLTMIFLWPKSDSHVWWNGKGSIAVPLLVSLPYVVRFRQCLSEFATMQPPPASQRRSGRWPMRQSTPAPFPSFGQRAPERGHHVVAAGRPDVEWRLVDVLLHVVSLLLSLSFHTQTC
ncbi:hypothetical protein L7F22_064813 [Adiantum nelumboides]|nr:hypothetical protein [Adiantum nelumboides]